MAEETQYTTNIGMVTISTGNDLRDGTGTLGDVISGASNGTLIKKLIIKAQTNTTKGTIRLYIYDRTNTRILTEISVPSVTKSSRDASFETHLDLDFFLQAGYILRVSSQNADTFNIIAIGLDVAYYASAVRTDTTQYSGGDGLAKLSLANTNLDGTGSLYPIIQASTVGSGWLGQKIEKIHIKATATTTPGMIRLFIQNPGSTITKLFSEIPVPAITPTAAAPSFEHVVEFNDDFFLQTGYKIVASTEKAESFATVTEGMLFKYLA